MGAGITGKTASMVIEQLENVNNDGCGYIFPFSVAVMLPCPAVPISLR